MSLGGMSCCLQGQWLWMHIDASEDGTPSVYIWQYGPVCCEGLCFFYHEAAAVGVLSQVEEVEHLGDAILGYGHCHFVGVNH
jgi:hypothetical protein